MKVAVFSTVHAIIYTCSVHDHIQHGVHVPSFNIFSTFLQCSHFIEILLKYDQFCVFSLIVSHLHNDSETNYKVWCYTAFDFRWNLLHFLCSKKKMDKTQRCYFVHIKVLKMFAFVYILSLRLCFEKKKWILHNRLLMIGNNHLMRAILSQWRPWRHQSKPKARPHM